MKYLTSVVMGILISSLLILLFPFVSLIVLVAGFLGAIKVKED